jgi:hypothetical protein
LALDDSFTDREEELEELQKDVLNGQDVVLFAPRRFGKSSLVWRLAQDLVKKKVLVAQVDLMTTPTRERLAAKLAKAIHDELATPLFKAKERLRIFQGLRIRPTINVDPEDGSLSFSFSADVAPADIDQTLERLLELPGELAGGRGRKVALILDEFQEIVSIDPGLPKLMRAAFQQQPEVAHLYLGSKRHMMQRIFNDENEPFWRSAKKLELGPIPGEPFEAYLVDRFESTGRKLDVKVARQILQKTHGHPYATQELAYFIWEETPKGRAVSSPRVEAGVAGVLRSEHAHFSLLWDRASTHQKQLLLVLAKEPGRPLARDYGRRHGLPGPSSVQRALTALEDQELVVRRDGVAQIAEPFLDDWLLAQGM